MKKNSSKPVRSLSLATHEIRRLTADEIRFVAAARGGATNVPTGGCGQYTCD